MGTGPFGRRVRIVWSLVVQGQGPARHPPIPKAALPLLAMELEVRPISGVAVVRAPNLDARLGVPGEYRDALAAASRQRVGVVGGQARRGSRLGGCLRLQELTVCPRGRTAGDEMRVDEEVSEAMADENVFEPRAVPGAGGAGRP